MITVTINGRPFGARDWPSLPKTKQPTTFTVIHKGDEFPTKGAYTRGKARAGYREYTYFTLPDGRVFYVDGHIEQASAITLPDDLNGQKAPIVAPVPPAESWVTAPRGKLKKGGKK